MANTIADPIADASLEWSLQHVRRFGDTDLLPVPFEFDAIAKDWRNVLDWLKREGIEPPRLYKLGFPHNNCGGFCIKAGQAHFLHLMKTFPDRFAYHEAKEQEIRDYLGADVSILRDRRGGPHRFNRETVRQPPEEFCGAVRRRLTGIEL